MQKMLTPLSPSIKMIIFDHDDTLVSTIKAKWAQHKYIAETFYGKKLSNADIRKHWGKPFTVLLKMLYETDHIDIAMSYNIATRDKFPKRLFPKTISTITALKNAGKKIGILTATTTSSLMHDFQALGIPRDLFDYIQTEDDTTHHKPDPRVCEPTIRWLEEHKIRANEVLCVGDQITDMMMAKAVGFNFIAVETGITSAQEFEKNQTKVVRCLPELLAL